MATLEKLRVYKQVCLKIRSSLVSGRDDLVSPTLVTRNFVEGFVASLNDPILSKHTLERKIREEEEERGRSEISGYRSSSSYGNGASANCGGSGDRKRGGERSSHECPFIEPAEGWSTEYYETRCQVCDSESLCACRKDISSNEFELRPLEEAAYRAHFNGVEHWNYFTDEPDIGPIVLSLKQEPCGEKFRILVRSSDHYLHGLIPVGELDVTQLSREEVVNAISRAMNLQTSFKPAGLPNMVEELLKIDETFVKNKHKVGLLRVKAGQTNEEEIFSNQHEPGPFEEFLGLMGDRVKLQGFKKFLGGLDGDRNFTGEESVFMEYKNMEVMFHVATLMPFSANDPQQVNKKRHIGNDIVCVVFLENSEAVFNPSWIRSHFIHSYVVVQHIVGTHGQPLYRIGVTNRSSVPTFSPDLQFIPTMPHCKPLQHILLSKIINAERASYHAPKFLKLTNRSRAQLLIELSACLTEFEMATKNCRATRKISRRGTWLPIGISRPPSPLLDPVREKYTNDEKLVEDLKNALAGPELADVMFIVGENRVPLFGVKSILACRSRVFKSMFKDGVSQTRIGSPSGRRRLNSSGARVNTTVSSPQLPRKANGFQPSPQKAKLMSAVIVKKKKTSNSSDLLDRSMSSSPEPRTPFLEEPKQIIQEQYTIPEFNDAVFSQVLKYLITGSCSIQPSTIVGITCAAEHFEIPELKQACFDQLSNCLMVKSVCKILTQLESYLLYRCAKTMVVRTLEFVDSNAEDILVSEDFLKLSENMVHLILRRDIEVQEILKVNAALDWTTKNIKPNQDFKKLVRPLVKHVRLHLIDAGDLMKIVVPSGIFEMEKVMTALAYQVDPSSVETNSYSMFKPKIKSSVLSSR